jgi:uncharacterized protein YfdQ (DUF2303 family)
LKVCVEKRMTRPLINSFIKVPEKSFRYRDQRERSTSLNVRKLGMNDTSELHHFIGYNQQSMDSRSE